MADYQDVAVVALRTMEEMVDTVPVKHRLALAQKLADIRSMQAAVAQARLTVVGQPGAGARAYWEARRANQRYNVDVRGEGSYVITGTDELMAFLGWKPNTLKLRMANGHGTVLVQKQIEGIDKVLTITRIPQ